MGEIMKSVVQVEIDTLNRVLDLLGSMPYNQVAALVQDLRENSKVVQIEETVETETTD